MKVTKWGNSLAIRLPLAVVKALGLKEGDQVDIRVSGERAFVVVREPRPTDPPTVSGFQVPTARRPMTGRHAQQRVGLPR